MFSFYLLFLRKFKTKNLKNRKLFLEWQEFVLSNTWNISSGSIFFQLFTNRFIVTIVDWGCCSKLVSSGLQRGTAMLRPQTDSGKSRPPMGGVRRRARWTGRRNWCGGGASEKSARRRDAEGVRSRGPPRTPVPVASTGGREPAPRHTDSAHAANTDFSPSTFFECAPVTAGTWYARGRSCFFLFRSTLWQLSVACDLAHFPPLPVAHGKVKSKTEKFLARNERFNGTPSGNAGFLWYTLRR